MSLRKVARWAAAHATRVDQQARTHRREPPCEVREPAPTAPPRPHPGVGPGRSRYGRAASRLPAVDDRAIEQRVLVGGSAPKEYRVSGRPKTHRDVRPARASGPGKRPPSDDEPDLLGQVRELLRAGDPVGVLLLASTIVSALEPKPTLPLQGAQADDGPSLAELVDSLIGSRARETTAMLAALACLVTDEVLGQHIRRELDRRAGALPAGLDSLEPLSVDRTVTATHVLGHVDTLIVGVLTAGGQPLTLVVTVDHELGTLVSDGFASPGPPEAAISRLADDDDPDLAVAEIEPGDARARIAEAIETGRITYPPMETETWPGCRPLLEWVLRALPEGGRGRFRPELDEPQRQEIARTFLASRHGRQHDVSEERALLDTLLWYACDCGTRDPLAWSPEAVAILLGDWLPRKVIAVPEQLDLIPDLLRDFIRFAHEERGLRQQLTEDALQVLDTLAPEYRRVIRTDDYLGPAALMADLGWIDDDPVDGPVGSSGPTEGGEASQQLLLKMMEGLREAVGGDQALAGLSADPLPEEPFDFDPVPGDVRARVGEVLGLLDRCADELFDVEFRTAVRRLLADLVAADAGIFRRRGRADTAAAAIAWIVARANELFDADGDGLSVGDLNDWFGRSSSPSQRAGTLLAALGITTDASAGMHLGTPRYLTSEHRRRIVRRRVLAQAELGSDDPTATDGREPHDARGDAPFWGASADAGDPREGPDRFDRTAVANLGVDPAPPAPWRGTEPADVLAVAWFPPGMFEDAVERWPELAARIGSRDYATYARIVQGTLIDLAREHARQPVLVPLDPDELPPMADHAGLEVTDWRTRAALAAKLAEAGRVTAWPPGRNDPCWCSSGRKYKKCCERVPVDPARRPTPTGADGGVQAYELDISLIGARPRIWRLIRIASSATFGDLHHAIQLACGWEDDHLFAFRTPTGTTIGGSPSQGPFGDPRPDATEVPIARYFAEYDRCEYEYDFGDGWLHDVRVVRRVEEPIDVRQQLLDGARAFPPEDCGGLAGYDACVAAATGAPDASEERREWLGDWDPERFDLAELRQWFDG